jgi:hypothetical protein
MRFLLDEDLSPLVAEIAQGLGLEVTSIHSLNRRGLPDGEQLQYSIQEARIFVTRNRDDFLRLAVQLFQGGEAYPGILIVPRSLPNDRPARIAHALQRWQEGSGSIGESFVDFLSD